MRPRAKGQSWEQLADWVPQLCPVQHRGKVANALRQEGAEGAQPPAGGEGRQRNSPTLPSLSCSPPGRPSTSPHLPDVVQELGGRQAVLWAGELAAVVLEEGQQVWLQVKQPAWGVRCQPWRGSSLQAPMALAALAAEEGAQSLGCKPSSPSAWHTPLGQLCRWPLLPLLHRGKHVFPRPHREAPPINREECGLGQAGVLRQET